MTCSIARTIDGVLMEHVSVDTQGLATIGANIAALPHPALTAAAAVLHDGAPELLGPVFGVVGGDFLAAYAAAHAGHVGSIRELSLVLASMSTAVPRAADSYTSVDDARAEALRIASDTLDAGGALP